MAPHSHYISKQKRRSRASIIFLWNAHKQSKRRNRYSGTPSITRSRLWNRPSSQNVYWKMQNDNLRRLSKKKTNSPHQIQRTLSSKKATSSAASGTSELKTSEDEDETSWQGKSKKKRAIHTWEATKKFLTPNDTYSIRNIPVVLKQFLSRTWLISVFMRDGNIV